MDFAKLLNMASQNADTASKTLADMKSKETQKKQEEAKQLETAKLAKKAKIAWKQAAIPEKKFSIPKKSFDKPAGDSSKVNTTSKKDEKVAVIMKKKEPEPKKAMKPERKSNKKPERNKESKPTDVSRKRPAPLDFGSLMKEAENNSQGKKANVDNFKRPSTDYGRFGQRDQSKRPTSSGQEKDRGEESIRTKTSVLKSKPNNAKNMVQMSMWGYVTPKVQRKRKSEEFQEEEDDEEYDSDFIDDTDENVDKIGRQELEDTLKMVNRKYDKNLWKHRERIINERDMVSNYRTIATEEARSARLGALEDRYEAKKNGSVAI